MKKEENSSTAGAVSAGTGTAAVSQHAPTPWRLKYDDVRDWEPKRAPYLQDIADADGNRIVLPCVTVTTARDGVPLANAAFIVRACNAYADMKEALEAIVERLTSFQEDTGTPDSAAALAIARAALSKTEA